ncbi:type II toxin-antitoxin system RelE/ParE family toxin [Patescibacteria group bacterium]|nr:type II toxin-antitoxin system RelE/ParE family toxin [Patescibacteria group bacterium]MBU1931641.1 type II toxin-antitoxin system RelE/ParE family toxin [Patescibacteria group bacterium]
MWKVDFFEKEIERFLDLLSKKERAKVLRNIFLLERFGLGLREPNVKSLKIKKLKELRIIFSSKIFRFLFFHYQEKTLVILHAFIKKTQKTPAKEIRIALERMKQYRKNKGGADEL